MATSKRFKASLHGNHSIITEALRLIQVLGNQIPEIRITPLPKREESVDPKNISSPVDLKKIGSTLICKVTTPNCWQEFRIVSNHPERVENLCSIANSRRLAQLAQLPG